LLHETFQTPSKHTRTGFSDEMLKDILKRLTPCFTDSCPFDPRPKANARVQWVKPELVCEVAFQERSSDGKLRAPAFLGLREDKAPTKVVREHLAALPEYPGLAGNVKAGQTKRIVVMSARDISRHSLTQFTSS